MVVTRYYLLPIFALVLLSSSFSLGYVVGCENGTHLFIWGEWGTSPDVQITLLNENGDTVYSGTPNYLYDYANSYKSGMYYAQIDLNPGKYILVIHQAGYSHSEIIDANCIPPQISSKILAVTQDPNEVKVLVNVHNYLDTSVTQKIYLYQRYGVSSKEVTLNPGDNLVEFDLNPSDFSLNNIVVVSYSGGYTYALVQKSLLDNGKVVFYGEPLSIMKGQQKYYTFVIENDEDYQVTYHLSYISNLEVYGTSEITLAPHEKEEVTISVTADKDFDETPYLHILVNNYEFDINVSVSGQNLDVTSDLPSSVLVNHLVEGHVFVKNIGSSEERISFSYTVDGTSYNYPYEITLYPGEVHAFPVSFKLNEDTTFVAYVNGEEVYTKDIEAAPIVKHFDAYFTNDSIHIFKGEMGSTQLVIKNTGNVLENIRVIPSDVSINVAQFSLKPEETKVLNVTFLGKEYGTHTYSIKVCNSLECKSYDFTVLVDMPVEKRTTVEFGDQTTFTPNQTFNYTIKITNNYPLNSISYTISVNGKPYEILVLKPNETKKVEVPLKFNDSEKHKVIFAVTYDDQKIEKNVTFIPAPSGWLSGNFYVKVGSVSWFALITLACIGVGVTSYFGYLAIRKKLFIEKTVVSNEFR